MLDPHDVPVHCSSIVELAVANEGRHPVQKTGPLLMVGGVPVGGHLHVLWIEGLSRSGSLLLTVGMVEAIEQKIGEKRL